ncbi:deoxyribose-phosphate aldolase [Gimesia algae]|uniref:Deoxyribose-phosphate aldolase n=1 Tax=Gimesia algae TaxID=2527971 RepID=A0A517VIT6_9PLAN|nr:deoxyribose-phosphate aldolase [Gimesia algae]QDT92915.1 Deoxyribose-phosphate aldolase [Gimesia algae]
MEDQFKKISKMIDHSLLSPILTVPELEAGCQLALAYDVASVCIMPFYLKRCAEILEHSTVHPSTTIGFPHGGHTVVMKQREAEQAILDGCEELDMVVNLSRVLSGDWKYVENEIGAITRIAHQSGQKIKVIFENCYLTEDQKIRLCRICASLRVDWVKTSTGYGTGGVTLDDLKLMRAHSPDRVQIKAAGGIRTLDQLLEVRDLGVSRVGASATRVILDTCRTRLKLPAVSL